MKLSTGPVVLLAVYPPEGRNLVPESQVVTTIQGATVTRDVALPPGAVLQLQVTDPASAPLAGADALSLARRLAAPDAAQRTLGLAAANALSRCLYRRAGWRANDSADSLGGLRPRRGEAVGMVGLFTPLIPRVLASGARLTVVELGTHLAAEHEGWRVTLDADALRQCDKVLATGTLVLNDTLDAMLARCTRARHVALVGPSLGCLPDALFARGVTLVGGSWVDDTPACVDALRRGEPHPKAARKVAITPRDYPGFDALLARL
ncbi:MAG TPA: DUF364 domain-containing protein [Rubrivivax sp.]|nr:DUF364 domain-containing protein [Rubrivivax sp.]